MAKLLEYKCPSCGGSVSFDGSAQKIKCPYCDSEFEPETFGEISFDSYTGAEWSGEADGMVSYVCRSCGGEIACTSDTAATDCPFCDSPIVIAGNVSGTLKPDVIVPFKLDKAAAKQAFLANLSNKRLLPKVFKDENHIDEIKGVYIPVWMFDASVSATATYDATRVSSWHDSSYNYTETKKYNVTRSGEMDFDNIPMIASSKVDSELLGDLEPYDMTDAKDFSAAYLAGYYADKFDITADECTDKVNTRIREGVEQVFDESMSAYSSATLSDLQMHKGTVSSKYALYPVWLLNTKWRDKLYTFAINGRTGSFSGELPMDKTKYYSWFAGVAAVSAVIIYLLVRLFGC